MDARELIEHFDDEPFRHQKRGRKPGTKRFGIEEYSGWFKKWYHRQWYATEKTRDQALEDLKRHTCAVFLTTESQYRKIDR